MNATARNAEAVADAYGIAARHALHAQSANLNTHMRGLLSQRVTPEEFARWKLQKDQEKEQASALVSRLWEKTKFFICHLYTGKGSGASTETGRHRDRQSSNDRCCPAYLLLLW